MKKSTFVIHNVTQKKTKVFFGDKTTERIYKEMNKNDEYDIILSLIYNSLQLTAFTEFKIRYLGYNNYFGSKVNIKLSHP